jgi:hypothetical protein
MATVSDGQDKQAEIAAAVARVQAKKSVTSVAVEPEKNTNES